jgi:excisionase family DNA binding protein
MSSLTDRGSADTVKVMARKLDGTTQEPGTPRTRARRQAAETTNAAPRSPERRRKPRPARPHLNMRGTLADAAPMMIPLEPLLAPKDVARYLGTTPKTVRRLVLDGHLRQLRIAGKATPRFRRQDVEALVTVDPISRKPRKPTGGTPTGGSTPPAP